MILGMETDWKFSVRHGNKIKLTNQRSLFGSKRGNKNSIAQPK